MFVQFLLLLDAKMTSGAGATAISSVLMLANIFMMLVIFLDLHTFLAQLQAFLKRAGLIKSTSEEEDRKWQEHLGDLAIHAAESKDRGAARTARTGHRDSTANADLPENQPKGRKRSTVMGSTMMRSIGQTIVNNVLEIYEGEGHTHGQGHGLRAHDLPPGPSDLMTRTQSRRRLQSDPALRVSEFNSRMSGVEPLGLDFQNPMHGAAGRRTTLGDLRSGSPSPTSPPASPKLPGRSGPPLGEQVAKTTSATHISTKAVEATGMAHVGVDVDVEGSKDAPSDQTAGDPRAGPRAGQLAAISALVGEIDVAKGGES